MTERAVGALQALVRIPTDRDRDPARVDADAFERLLVELARQFPLALLAAPKHAFSDAPAPAEVQ